MFFFKSFLTAILLLSTVLLEGTKATAQEAAVPTQLINRLLAKSWKENKLTPSPRTTDAEFLKRVSVDILGRTPTQAEVDAFARDKNRTALVNRMLADNAYNAHWAGIWTRWLLPDSFNPQFREQTRTWLEQQFARKTSHKKLVQELLTATGKNSENGAVNFVLAHVGTPFGKQQWQEDGQFEMAPLTTETARLFLGVRLECAQCHDHPFTPEWKQQHFWGLNDFFRQVERKGVPCDSPKVATALELSDNVAFNKSGKARYERRNGKQMTTGALFIDGKRPDADGNRPRREILAGLVVNHAMFARVHVNRIWHHFLGRGLTEQPTIDDFGDFNPVVHPELLDELAKSFVDGGHDSRKLIAWICASDAYQLQTIANGTNAGADAAPYFSRMLK